MSEFVVYKTKVGLPMRALVTARHHDGGLSVEPYVLQHEEGRDTGIFQGGIRVRLKAGDATPLQDVEPGTLPTASRRPPSGP